MFLVWLPNNLERMPTEQTAAALGKSAYLESASAGTLLRTIRHKVQKTWRCCGCLFVAEGEVKALDFEASQSCVSNLCLQSCQSCSAAQLLQPLWDQGSGFGLSMQTLHVLLMLVWVLSGYPVASHSPKPWALCWLETENWPWVGASTLIWSFSRFPYQKPKSKLYQNKNMTVVNKITQWLLLGNKQWPSISNSRWIDGFLIWHVVVGLLQHLRIFC